MEFSFLFLFCSRTTQSGNPEPHVLSVGVKYPHTPCTHYCSPVVLWKNTAALVTCMLLQQCTFRKLVSLAKVKPDRKNRTEKKSEEVRYKQNNKQQWESFINLHLLLNFQAYKSTMSTNTQKTRSCPIPTRVIQLKDWSQLPDCYSQTPGGTLFSTTPGGEHMLLPKKGYSVRSFH